MRGLSQRAGSCKPSPTLGIASKANQLKKEGRDIISLSAGQPDFEPPEIIKKGIVEALNKKGSGKYTSASGTPELKQEIIEKFKNDNNIEYSEKNITINNGAKHTIYNIFQAIINDGDEVIIPVPYWVSYPEMVSLAGGKPVFADTGYGFRIMSEKISEKITEKTKAVIINSPSNPSGAVIDDDELIKLGEIAVKNDLYIISDEIYEKIIYEKKHISIASLSKEIKERTFTVNGISKSLAVPGWRLGYVAGSENVIAAINRIQSHSTSNTCSLVQHATSLALNNANDFIKDCLSEFRKRRELIVDGLNSIPGFGCNMPEGAFYVFPKLPVDDDISFCKQLLEKKGVAVVPGSYFGLPGYARMSYATGTDDIKKAIERIKEFVEER